MLLFPSAITLKSLESEKDHRFVIHALQAVPHMSSKSCEHYKMAGLAPGTSCKETFKIEVQAAAFFDWVLMVGFSV